MAAATMSSRRPRPTGRRACCWSRSGWPVVAGRDELEEQVRGLGFERDVADLVDDHAGGSGEFEQLRLEVPGVVGGGEPVDRLTGGGELDPVPAWQARIANRSRGAVLAVPGGPRNTRRPWRPRVQGPQVGDDVVFRSAGVVEVKSSNDLRAGKRAARIRPSPPWDSRADTSRCRQAIRNSSCDQDSDLARSASRATASRIVGASVPGAAVLGDQGCSHRVMPHPVYQVTGGRAGVGAAIVLPVCRRSWKCRFGAPTAATASGHFAARLKPLRRSGPPVEPATAALRWILRHGFADARARPRPRTAEGRRCARRLGTWVGRVRWCHRIARRRGADPEYGAVLVDIGPTERGRLAVTGTYGVSQAALRSEGRAQSRTSSPEDRHSLLPKLCGGVLGELLWRLLVAVCADRCDGRRSSRQFERLWHTDTRFKIGAILEIAAALTKSGLC